MNADVLITIAFGGPAIIAGLITVLALLRRHRQQEAAREQTQTTEDGRERPQERSRHAAIH